MAAGFNAKWRLDSTQNGGWNSLFFAHFTNKLVYLSWLINCPFKTLIFKNFRTPLVGVHLRRTHDYLIVEHRSDIALDPPLLLFFPTTMSRQVILDSIHFHLDSIFSYLRQPASIITRLFVNKKKLKVFFKVMLHETIFNRTSVAHNMLHNFEQTSNTYNVVATNWSSCYTVLIFRAIMLR